MISNDWEKRQKRHDWPDGNKYHAGIFFPWTQRQIKSVNSVEHSLLLL